MAKRNPFLSSHAAARKTPPLSVVATDHARQFYIENDYSELDDFDREYVSIGGFFGNHGPHVFAAAPELLVAVKDLLAPLERASIMLEARGKKLDSGAQASLDAARAAVTKAEGGA